LLKGFVLELSYHLAKIDSKQLDSQLRFTCISSLASLRLRVRFISRKVPKPERKTGVTKNKPTKKTCHQALTAGKVFD